MAGRRRLVLQFLTWIGLGVAMAFFSFPIYWMVQTSLKPPEEVLFGHPFLFAPTMANYRRLFSQTPFLPSFYTTLVVAGTTLVISMALGSLAGYSLARFTSRVSQQISLWTLSTRMFPPIAVVIPFFVMMHRLRLVGTTAALVIAYVAMNLPLVIWLTKGFFEEIPRELEEAALIDGCDRLSAFLRVALPLVRPGLFATSLLVLIFSSNEFMFALVLGGANVRTVPLAVSRFVGLLDVEWGMAYAGTTVASIPVLAYSFFARRSLIKGLTLGAVKE